MNQATVRLSQQLQRVARELDQSIERAAGERIAFTLLVFTEGRASYEPRSRKSNMAREGEGE